MSPDDVSFDAAEDLEVAAEYAHWLSVADPGDNELYPRLVLGTDRCELHLALDPEHMDELMANLVPWLPSEVEETEKRSDGSLPNRLGTRIVAASGWSATSRMWRDANANTRIVIYGLIAAFIAFGLLVTF
ncbi:hypothetical protein [Streptomyces sp. NPDC051572]|uniref:hypothetical protein n=1 Tax=Streptomyces sp. NPDC051572 TaxID=3155802 RepID=UPI00344E8E93